MRGPLLACALLSAFALGLRADEPAAPKGPPPEVRLVTFDTTGDLLLQVPLFVPVTRKVKRPVTEEVDGKKVTRVVEEELTAYERRTVTQTVKSKGMRASDGAGERVSPKALAKRLARWTPVVVSLDGQPVDPAYLKLFKKDVLVLVLAGPAVAEPPVGIPEEVKPDKKADDKPLSKAELKRWADYLKALDGEDRKTAEALWKEAKTNRAKRALLREIPSDP
jgi:hypothetical protein